MNWVLDDKKLNRLVGIGAWFVLIVVLMPLLMQRALHVSEQNEKLLEQSETIIPTPPIDKPLGEFHPMPIAKVDLDKPAIVKSIAPPKRKQLVSQLPQVEEHPNKTPVTVIQAIPKPQKQVVIQKPVLKTPVYQPVKKVAVPVVKKPMVPGVIQQASSSLTIQLGSFSQEVNASGLVKKLKQQGYFAAYYPVRVNQALMYKVIAGQARTRAEAQLLQQRLYQVTQIKGMIVPTGVR